MECTNEDCDKSNVVVLNSERKLFKCRNCGVCYNEDGTVYIDILDKRLTSEDVRNIVDNVNDISAVTDEIFRHGILIDTAQKIINKLLKLDYSQDVCESLDIDGVECGLISQETAQTIHKMIIKDKQQLVVNWNLDILETKKRLAKLI